MDNILKFIVGRMCFLSIGYVVFFLFAYYCFSNAKKHEEKGEMFATASHAISGVFGVCLALILTCSVISDILSLISSN